MNFGKSVRERVLNFGWDFFVVNLGQSRKNVKWSGGGDGGTIKGGKTIKIGG